MTIRQNFYVRQGASFSYTYANADDLTGYTASWRVAGGNEYTPVIAGSDVTLSLSPAQTSALGNVSLTGYGAYADAIWGGCTASGMSRATNYADEDALHELSYVLDVESGGAVERLLEGVITVIKNVD